MKSKFWLELKELCGVSKSSFLRHAIVATSFFVLSVGGVGRAEAVSLTGKVLGTLANVDLVLYMPAVMDPVNGVEVEIDDTLEKSRGSMTFVNLDNDDGDDIFDINDTDVVGGDDELVKVELKLMPALLYQTGYFDTGNITFSATAGAGDIRVYFDVNKATPYTLGDTIAASDFTEGLLGGTKTIYIEGVQAHTLQKQTEFAFEFSNGVDSFIDEGSLTVVGVDSIVWEGKNNSVNNSNILDADPSYLRIPAGSRPSTLAVISPVRVFPGKRLVGAAPEPSPRNKVDVKVTLTVAPTYDFSLFLKAFDMDDPTEDQGVADDDSIDEDNRGCANFIVFCSPATFVTGAFIDPVSAALDGEYEMEFKASLTTLDEKVEFEVTMQPGDNFAVASNADKDFVDFLQNDDIPKTSAAGVFPVTFTSTQLEVEDNLRITDSRKISATIADNEILEAEHYMSQILTVWRFLHFEVDSMAAPPIVGLDKNTVDREISRIRSVGGVATEIEVAPVASIGGLGPLGVQGEVNVDAGALFRADQSPNRDSPIPERGRFENGILTFSGTGTVAVVEENGNDYLYNSTGFNINFSATIGGSTLVGTVINFDPASNVFMVNVPTTPATAAAITAAWTALAAGGGIISVEGTPMIVAGVNQVASTITVTAYTPILIEVRDNDTYVPAGASLINISLVGLPTPHFGGLQEVDVMGANQLAQVFIRPVYDLTNATYTDQNVRFISNSEYSGVYDWDTVGFMNDRHFWPAYILYAYQDSWNDMAKDMDAEAELGSWASANNGSNGGVLIYLESLTDGSGAPLITQPAEMNHLMSHEVGHNLTLPDLQPPPAGPYTPCTAGIMFGQLPFNAAMPGCRKYILDHVDKLRKLEYPSP